MDDVLNVAKTLQKLVEKTNSGLQEREEIIKERETKFENEKKEMEKRYPINENVIDLNVGGKLFTTFKKTLCAVEGSMLEAMFSGRHPVAKDSQGRYFIDRDGDTFGIILNYFRTGELLWPKDENANALLKLELEYYLLEDLIPQPLFPESKILTPEMDEKLESYMDAQSHSWVLLYRGSRDGFMANNFHTKCDGKGPTVTIVKTTLGYIFGGYASQSWNSSSNYIQDNSAFLFCLKSALGTSCKCAVKNPGNALYGHPGHGPIFGGHDLLITNNCANANSTITVGNSYQQNQGPHEFTGQQHFMVQEIEVFGKEVDAPTAKGFPLVLSDNNTPLNNNQTQQRRHLVVRRKNVMQ